MILDDFPPTLARFEARQKLDEELFMPTDPVELLEHQRAEWAAQNQKVNPQFEAQPRGAQQPAHPTGPPAHRPPDQSPQAPAQPGLRPIGENPDAQADLFRQAANLRLMRG